MIDEVNAEGAIGPSIADAPDIDGTAYLDGVVDVQPGDFAEAMVKSAEDCDVWAGP